MTMEELFQACELGDFKTLKRLLEKNPEWLHATRGNETLLHVAPTPEIASYLLEQGIPVDVSVDPNSRWTPVMGAVRRSNWDTVRFLIQKGADVFVRDSRKMGLLEAAIDDGQFDLAEELLERGVPVEVERGAVPALKLSVQKGPLTLTHRILEKVTDKTLIGESSLRTAIRRGGLGGGAIAAGGGSGPEIRVFRGKRLITFIAVSCRERNVFLVAPIRCAHHR